ncbi:MAG: response regulator transcription factor [Bacteroidetes bacterium]|nr:response regulator transcription factor [Bacteroidota bacterium]
MENVHLQIALLDDHQLLSQSLANLLYRFDFIKDIAVYNSPKTFLAAGQDYEILISDIMMPKMNGIDLLLKIKKLNTGIKVIFLSSVMEAQTIRFALRSGANGYISKDTSVEELADAILAVHNGDVYIGESLRNILLRNTLTEERLVFNLSPREREVLNLVCSGKTIKETAYDMELSVHTVQTYYKTILKKFNLNRTADLIVFAMKNGLYIPGDGINR